MELFLLQGGAPAGGGDMWNFPVMMIGIFVIMYFLWIRPQQRERKKVDALRKNLKKGDRVMTQGGILAKVQQVKGTEIVLDLDGSSRMTVVQAAITTVFPADGEAPAPKEKEQGAKA